MMRPRSLYRIGGRDRPGADAGGRFRDCHGPAGVALEPRPDLRPDPAVAGRLAARLAAAKAARPGPVDPDAAAVALALAITAARLS
jgi:hypothetical protein